MGALTQAFQPYGAPTTLKNIHLPLATNQTAWQGGRAAIDTSTGTVKACASGNTNLVPIGDFTESLTTTSAAGTIGVALDHEIVCRWWDNVTGGNAVTTLFTTCYMLDDHTVTNSASGNAAAGRVWALDATKGVLVENTGL